MYHSFQEEPIINVDTNKPSRLRVQFKDICPQELLQKHNGDLEEAYKEFVSVNKTRYTRYKHLYFIGDKKKRKLNIYETKPCVFCLVGNCEYEGFPNNDADADGIILVERSSTEVPFTISSSQESIRNTSTISSF